MAISTPFRFARINRWVFKPEWGPLVSHDVPFKDGYSGTIEFTIKAETPLIVGGPRALASNTVYPFQLPCGKYAIPSSSIQGMIRPILEIATFGKLGPFVQDRRFAVRDISGQSETAKQIYQERMTEGSGTARDGYRPRAKSGWLLQTPRGIRIFPCKFARINYGKIKAVVKVPDPTSPEGFTQLTDDQINFIQRTNPRPTSDQIKKETNANERYLKLLGASVDLNMLEVDIELDIQGDLRNPVQAEYFHSGYYKTDKNGRLVEGAAGQYKWQKAKYLRYTKCGPPQLGATITSGTLVITGKASPDMPRGTDAQNEDTKRNNHSASNAPRGSKHSEFVFHTPSRVAVDSSDQSTCPELPSDVIRDFFAIHDPDTGEKAEPNPNWAFWKAYFEKGEPVPVFYLEEGKKVVAIGTAQMFKLAMKLSTHDLLNNSAFEHTSKKEDAALDPSWGDWDLPSLIFGATSGSEESYFEKNLKRRASFDFAVQVGEARQDTNGFSATLLSPKPSYYPIYLRQRDRFINNSPVSTHRNENTQYVYATYNEMIARAGPYEKFPELSGVKIWPSVGLIQQPNNGEANVQTKLKPLGIGAEFKCAVRITNLRKFELGALLWALTLGDSNGTERRVHKLGGGKPLGLGSVSIAKLEATLVANDGSDVDLKTKELIDHFVEKMTEFTKAARADEGVGWYDTPQVKALMRVSTTKATENSEYRYMRLSLQPPVNDFQDNKAGGYFLPDFAEHPVSEFSKKPPPKRPIEPPTPINARPTNLGNELTVPRSAPALPANIARRSSPPEPQPNHPVTNRFELGQRISAKNFEWWVIGYPSKSLPTTQQNNLKWYLGRYSDKGMVFYDDVIQQAIRPIMP
jgi:CRISPR-associated protein (TIGR03986 family)